MSGLFDNPSPIPAGSELANLDTQLKGGPEKVQLQLLQQLAEYGEPGLQVLIAFLRHPPASTTLAVLGRAYQILLQSGWIEATNFLKTDLPQGVVSLDSEAGIDYSSLQQHLVAQEFQAADQLTLQKLCELAGPAAVKREWLYFTEVENFPVRDLQTIDALWRAYSQGQFGFSVQREIWLAVGKNWEQFWPKIGWKAGNNWTRYPQGFTWNLTAPRGHLPLSNQLRGVRVIASLLSHPAWLTS